MKQILNVLMILFLLGLVGCSGKQAGSVYNSSGAWKKITYNGNTTFAEHRSQLKRALKPVWENRIRDGRITPEKHWTADTIVDALVPADGKVAPLKSRGVVLLLHGLYDSPYVMKDLGEFFNSKFFSTRFLLLPRHGTQPGDMIDNTWQQWEEAVDYAVNSIRKEFKEQPIYMAGFSTGGALAINHAVKDKTIKGLFLFAPLLDIRWPRVAGANFLRLKGSYVQKKAETDTFKYESTTINSVLQANKLANHARNRLIDNEQLEIPVFLSAAINDYTLPTKTTLSLHKANSFGYKSYFLLFSPEKVEELEPERCDGTGDENILDSKDRTLVCNSHFKFSQAKGISLINEFSHMSLTLKPDDLHYGLDGNYSYCLHYSGDDAQECKRQRGNSKIPWRKKICYGERTMLSAEYSEEEGLCPKHNAIIRRLTSNPRFKFLTSQMGKFIDKHLSTK